MQNYINGQWQPSKATATFLVTNPATGEELGRTPLSPAEEVHEAALAASRAFPLWRRVPVTDRVQYLFKLKALLEQEFDALARIVTTECGKTLAESKGELRRAIENVEVACGAPTMMQGYNSEDIAAGIDEIMIRQPLGVVAIIAPFNFPGMIPFWFLPYAIATGNTVIVKPSERVPFTMRRVFELLASIDLPKGVVNLVNGGRESVDAILDHPTVRAVSFVGSSTVARHVYARGAASGKRVQCQGGAKNPVVILPGCRHGFGGGNHRRQRVRLRRPTLPGGLVRGHGGRSPWSVPRRHPGQGLDTRDGQWTGRGRADGPGDLARESRAYRRLDRSGRARRRAGRRRRPRGCRRRRYTRQLHRADADRGPAAHE